MAYTKFRVPMGYRLYDREQNKVVPLNVEEYRTLEKLSQGKEDGSDCSLFQNIQKKGYCCESSLIKIEHPKTYILKPLLSKMISNALLQVTQNCNLRCSYCGFSGNYYNRSHNQKRMMPETAFRAVDFLMKHSSGVNGVVISFYGGEPFLEFELIKKIVEYVEKEYPERDVQYTLTSNLTLFTDEIIEYLARKDMRLLISIDGPREVQDKYRLFANGQGSFDTVVANARKMETQYPQYFRKCATNTVVSPNENYDLIREFLDNDGLFGSLNSMISRLSDTGIKKEVQYNDDYYRVTKREIFKNYLCMLGQIAKEKTSRTYARDLSGLLELFQSMKDSGTQNVRVAHPAGPCVPGIRKVFIDVNGNFYPCERISEHKKYQIGSLDSGFNLDNIQRLMNIGRYTEKECLDCWAFLHCGMCAVSMIEGTDLSREKRLKKCKEIKGSILSKMADTETLKYYGYDFENV